VPSFALHGIGVSGGIAIGRAQLVSHATLEVAHYAVLAQRHSAPKLKGPFNRDARSRAGFSDEELAYLESTG